MSKWSGTLVWILIIGVLASYYSNNSHKRSVYDSGEDYSYSNDWKGKTIDRDEAISEHWDEIREYVNGSETIDVCSEESGNCYSLDADIYHGEIDELYFPNGGYLYFGADIDENGSASDFDQNGNAWDFSVDMNSSTIDDAIYEWASDNGYTID